MEETKQSADFEEGSIDVQRYVIEQDTAEQDSTEQGTAKQDDAKQDATEQDATKQDTIKRDTMEHDAIEPHSTEQDPTEQDTAKRDDTEKDATQQGVDEHDTAEQDTTEQDTAMQEAAEQDSAEQDVTEQDINAGKAATEHDAAEQDSAKQDATEQDTAKQDDAEQDAAEQDATEQDIVEQNTMSSDTMKLNTQERNTREQKFIQLLEVNEQDNEEENRRNKIRIFLKILEVSLLALVMLLLIGLFLIPTLFYALTPEDADQVAINDTINSSVCENAVPYAGEICADVFLSLEVCYSGEPDLASNIPSNIDEDKAESTANLLLTNLESFLQPTEECLRNIRPFLCLHLFGYCDSNNDFHTTLMSKCLRIRDDVCSQEWIMAVSLLPPNTLPVCENLPNKTEECKGNSNSTTTVEPINEATFTSPNCSKGFFHDINITGLCRPKCGEFRHKGYATIIPERIAMCISLIASVVMFILALTYQRSTLLTFPSNLLVYLCGTTFLLAAVIAIGSIDNRALFCSTEDQIIAASEGNQTAYCTFSGIVFHYTLSQTCVWALLHAIFLFWSLIFPFSYRRLRISGKARYAHVISVLVALLTPLPGALAPLKDGYISTRNPSLVCQARNADYIYFFLVLPLSVVLAVSSCLMVVTFWVIFKEFVLKKLIAGKKVGQIGKAEIKMAVISSYYIIVGVLSLFTFTYFEVKTKANRDGLVNLFLCESSGNPACEERVNTVAIDILNILAEIVLVLVAFFPVVALLFSYDTRTYKKVRGSLKITSKSSTRTSSLHKNLPVYRSKS